jgi:hypothetical protein
MGNAARAKRHLEAAPAGSVVARPNPEEPSLRVADGNELPQGWLPGQPLSVGRHARPSGVEKTCPFGAQCYSCRNGMAWDAVIGKHLPTRNRNRRKLHQRRRSA